MSESHKPARGLRAFLKEYFVIVIGVLTALAAEQAAEWVHWRNEVAQARTALRAEIAPDSPAFARRIAYRPCMDRQIAEADAIIADLEAGRTPRPYTALHTGVV